MDAVSCIPQGKAWLAAACLFAAGCAATADADPTRFDSSAGSLEWRVHGDGFLQWDQRRMPVDAAILQLRLQTRAMAPEAVLQLVVQVSPAPVAGYEDAAAEEVQRLLRELQIMGVRQVRLM
jgi:hypothetical protein